MSDEKNPFRTRNPRPDREQTFPPLLQDPTGPAMLGTMPPVVASLIGAHLMRLVASSGGSRVGSAAAQEAIAHLERAVSADVVAHCREEALRIARWTQTEPQTPPPPPRVDELKRIQRADLKSRISVVRWAIDQELDLQMEWYDETEDRWPHDRVRPIDLEENEGEDAVLRIRFGSDEREVPVIHIRWVMPVERRADPRVPPPEATILPFRRRDEEE